jgi:hypothetical protein
VSDQAGESESPFQGHQQLTALRLEWGDWYYLGWQAGQFFAVRKDDGSVARRPGAEALRKELVVDFVARPGRR